MGSHPLWVAVGWGLSLAAGCGNSFQASSDCPDGSEGCACFSNSTCDDDLDCRSNTCVDLGASGGSGSGGDSGAGGSSQGGSSGDGASGGSDAGGSDSGGAAGSSGSTSSGGSSGSSGVGTGGSGGNAGVGGGGSGGSGGCEPNCNEDAAVVILVDGSSSMFEGVETPWERLETALFDPMEGALWEFEGRLRLGLTIFRGHNLPTTEDDPLCAELDTAVAMLDSYEALPEVYADVGAEYPPAFAWETPTGHALGRVATALATEAGSRAAKYILLITDGEPNTCGVLNPQCGQDNAISAVQAARASHDVRTIPIGIASAFPQCDSSAGRCGADYVQDLANAGAGLNVEEPPYGYLFQQCISNQVLEARYATPGDNATARMADSVSQLRDAVTEALNAVLAGEGP